MIRILLFLASGLGAAAIAAAQAPAPGGSLAPDSGAFELRTYTAAPG